MRLRFATLLASVAALLLGEAALLAQKEKVIVYPVEAIVDSANLSRREFDQRHPGIDITSFGLTDEGWYVRYKHELLTYLYGPIYNVDDARRAKKLLEEIRLSFVLKDPKLSSSAIDIIKFTYSDDPDAVPIDTRDNNPYINPELKK